MITTFLALMLLAFMSWLFSAEKKNKVQPPAYLHRWMLNRQAVRLTGAGLALLSTTGFVWKLGWQTGLFAALTGLMCAGCLVVFARPYRLIKEKELGFLYLFFLLMEIII